MFLPSPGGRFPVGATTFKLAVPRRTVSSVKVRSTTSSKLRDTLVLEEVAFTAFYPADVPLKSTPRGIPWLLRPSSASLQGYSSYTGLALWVLWPLVYLFGILLKIPVYPGAPLLNPHEITRAKSSKTSPWPLVIFSHGLGGSRTTYSQLCTRMASSGRVVLAIEHRDGSGHAAVPSSSDPITYVKEARLVWPLDRPAEKRNMLSFRGEQLEFRREEIYQAFRAIRDLVRDGREDGRYSLDTMGDISIDWSRWTNVGSGKPIECEENVVLAGHSFGAATVVKNDSSIPINKALILDPWLEPIPSPGPLPHSRFEEESLPNILVINSEVFTLWKDHFERLMEVGKSWAEGGWELLTIVKSQHISFSDFRVLPLMLNGVSRMLLDKIGHLSLAFLDDDWIGTTAGLPATKMKVRVVGRRTDGQPRREIEGNLCDVILH